MAVLIEKNSEPPLSAVGQNGINREAEEKTKHLKKVRWNDEKRKENSSDGESDSVAESEEETKRQPQKQTKKTKQNDIEIVPVEDNGKAKIAASLVKAQFFFVIRHPLPFPSPLVDNHDRAGLGTALTLDLALHGWTF